MQVGGILETALPVADPARSAEFYRRVFGVGTLLENERLGALDVAAKSVLLLFRAGATGEPFETPGGVIPPHGGPPHGGLGRNHFAFAIEGPTSRPGRPTSRRGASP